MMRLELYLNKKNRPVIDVYKDTNNEIESARLKGYHALELVDRICTHPIEKISSNNGDMSLKYTNFIANIREYNDFLKLNEMKEFKNKIERYYNIKNQIKVQKKRVKRKNKYSGKKIIAVTLVVSFLGLTAVSAYQKNDIPSNFLPKTNYTFAEEEPVSLNQTPIIEIESNDQNPSKESETIEETTSVCLNYQDRSDTEKAKITKSYYGNEISKYAETYGLDTELMIAIATQERGVHSEKKDSGGATGLMQIQNSVWRNQKLTAYNYKTRQYETIIVEESKLSNLSYNIRVGCMIFQNALNYMNYNVIAAVQCYNMGYGNMQKILKYYSNKTGKSINQILENTLDTGWLEYRKIINEGDRKYVENVFSWMKSEDIVKILNKGEEITVSINNSYKSK